MYIICNTVFITNFFYSYILLPSLTWICHIFYTRFVTINLTRTDNQTFSDMLIYLSQLKWTPLNLNHGFATDRNQL